jgi:tetratricopeptide (TPR) repeat protein
MSIDTASMPTTETTQPGYATAGATEYPSDIEALAKEHGLDQYELASLMACARASGATRQQLPGVLRQACSRLDKLRSHAFRELAGELPAGEIAAAVARAQEALRAGPAFSLEMAEQSFGEALAHSLGDDATTPNMVASIAAGQAELAAAAQLHRKAAELYARVAEMPGLDEATQWQFQYGRAAALDELGRDYGADEALREAVELYENTVLPLAPRSERPADWSATQHALGNALGILGQRARGIHSLERSVEAFENALSERGPEQTPMEWAASRHGLGNALGNLAQRQQDVDMLERAVSEFERALETRHREQSPWDWAMNQYHLGTALLTLGQIKHDTSVLARSIEAYRQVLEEWTRERAPLDWAKTQNSLGTVLRARGEQGGDPRELAQAVAAYRSALDVWAHDQWPEEWAIIQNNLGAALHRLGERENNAGCLGEAVTAYENALQELRREDKPIAWAMSRANLGVARRGLAERTRDGEMSRQAVSDFEAVAEVFRDASHPQYYHLAKEQLSYARKLAAELAGLPVTTPCARGTAEEI